MSDEAFQSAQVNIQTGHLASKRESEYRFNYQKIPELTNHLIEELCGYETIDDPEIAADKLISAYRSGIRKFSSYFKPTRKKQFNKTMDIPSYFAINT